VPKVDSLPPAPATVRCASGCMLGTPSIRRYSSPLAAVTTRPVRTISREVLVTPQRPYAGHPTTDDEMVRSAWRHAGATRCRSGRVARLD
jgi:hypothetical protein